MIHADTLTDCGPLCYMENKQGAVVIIRCALDSQEFYEKLSFESNSDGQEEASM